MKGVSLPSLKCVKKINSITKFYMEKNPDAVIRVYPQYTTDTKTHSLTHIAVMHLNSISNFIFIHSLYQLTF